MNEKIKNDEVPPNSGHRRRERIREFAELAIWFAVGLFPNFGVIIDIISFRRGVSDLHRDSVALTVIVFMFVLVFQLTFLSLPIATVRRYVSSRWRRDATKVTSEAKAPDEWNPRRLLAEYARQSGQLSQSVYTRSGVYLIVGVLISVSGLAVFWARSLSYYEEKLEMIEKLIYILPGAGVLFFMELVAFFFLRQHRAAMDDFRYFDSIRRHREENVVLLSMFAEDHQVVSASDVIKVTSIYSGVDKLTHGETTEILESRRLQKDELIIFEKLADALGNLKRLRTDKKDA